MVELVVAKCPRCGGDLQVKQDAKTAYCSYCDAEILILGAQGPSGGSSSVSDEIEKRKFALELEEKHLSELESDASRLNAEMMAIEKGEPRGVKSAAGAVVMLLFILVVLDISTFPVFYLLNISYIYGVSHELCLTAGILVLVVGIAGIIIARVSLNMSMAKRRSENLKSTEYTSRAAKYQELQARIAGSKDEVERIEQQLKSLL